MDTLTDQKRKKIPMSLKLDPELWDMLQVLRKDLDRSQNWLIENALKQTYLPAKANPRFKDIATV